MERNNWMTLSEAAALWNTIMGTEVFFAPSMSAPKLRRMFRMGTFQELGVNHLVTPDRYYIDRCDFLRATLRSCAVIEARIEEEMAKSPGQAQGSQVPTN